MLALDPTTNAEPRHDAPTRLCQASLIALHRGAQRYACAHAARPATSSMCASSTPDRCVDHEPPRRLSAIAPGRAGRATACYHLLFASSGRTSADGPFRSLSHARDRPAPPHRGTGRGNGSPPDAYHQPQRRSANSIAADAAPPRSVQPSFCGGFAPQKLLLRSLALASLDRACQDHRPDVSATLTTTAFDRSSLRWLGIGDLITEPEGPSFISSTVAQRRVDRRCSRHKTLRRLPARGRAGPVIARFVRARA